MNEIYTNLLQLQQVSLAETANASAKNMFSDNGTNNFENIFASLNEKLSVTQKNSNVSKAKKSNNKEVLHEFGDTKDTVHNENISAKEKINKESKTELEKEEKKRAKQVTNIDLLITTPENINTIETSLPEEGINSFSKTQEELSAQIQFTQSNEANVSKEQSSVGNFSLEGFEQTENEETINLDISELEELQTSNQKTPEDMVESIEVINDAAEPSELNPFEKTLKDKFAKEDNSIDSLETTEENNLETGTNTNDSSQFQGGEEHLPQNGKDSRPIAENLFERTQFLNGEKTIGFNKVVDRATAISNTTSTNSPQQINKPDFFNQLNQGLSNLSNENTKVNIVLRPEALGKVTVELQNGKDGLVAKFMVDSPQVKDVLDKSIENLKNTLANQGVNVNNITVKVESSTGAENSGSFEFSQNNNFEQNTQTNSNNQNSQKFQTASNAYAKKQSFETFESEQSEQSEQIVQKLNTGLGQIDYRI